MAVALAFFSPWSRLSVEQSLFRPMSWLLSHIVAAPNVTASASPSPTGNVSTTAASAADLDLLGGLSIDNVYSAPWPIFLRSAWPRIERNTPLQQAGAWASATFWQPGGFVRSFWWLLLAGVPVFVTALVSVLSSLPLFRPPIDWVKAHHKGVRASVWLCVASLLVLEGAVMFSLASPGPSTSQGGE